MQALIDLINANGLNLFVAVIVAVIAAATVAEKLSK